MKIPSNQGIISVYGSQEDARKTEGILQDTKIVYNIDETEARTQVAEKQIKDKASSADQPKPVLLCDDIAD
jgi:hypothetical protein